MTAALQPDSVHVPALSCAEVNRVQAAIEARAHDEFTSGHPRAMEWLCDAQDIGDLARVILLLSTWSDESSATAVAYAWRLECDYAEFRAATASEHEFDDIAAEQAEDA